jgi:hypothetical protein
VLTLKKHSLRPDSDDLPNIQESREKLIGLLEGIFAALKSDIDKAVAPSEKQIAVPAEVLDRIYNQFKHKLPYFLDDIKGVADKLRQDAEIDRKALDLLDTLCDVTDGVASNAFRRLWRR